VFGGHHWPGLRYALRAGHGEPWTDAELMRALAIL